MLRLFSRCPFAVRILLVASAVLSASAVPGPLARATAASVKILSNEPCGRQEGDTIGVCGLRVEKDDMVRLHMFAECIVGWQKVSATQAVAAYVRTGDASRLRTLVVADRSCPSFQKMSVSAILLGGAFAEALLKTPLRAMAVPASLTTSPSGLRSAEQPIDCLMRVARPEVILFLRAPLYTRDELSLGNAILQHIATCLPAGATLQTRHAVLRSVVALRLFSETFAGSIAKDAAASSQMAEAAPLSVALDVAPSPASLQTYRIDVPMLKISGAEAPREDGIIVIRRHIIPDLPDKEDPEPYLAREAAPAVDPDTGEMIDQNARIPAENDFSPTPVMPE